MLKKVYVVFLERLAVKKILLILCFLFINLNAKIVEIKNITEVYKYIDEEKKSNIIVLFDIDNTLTEPIDDYGEQWFSAKVKQEMNRGLNALDATRKVLPLYFEKQKNIKVKPVEDSALEVVNYLKEKEITTLALTSRSEVALKYAYNQLKSIQISFDPEFLGKEAIKLEGQEHPAFYYRGLIGCDQNSKGECLKEFIESFKNKWPELKNKTCIIMIDDKEKYLHQIEDAFKDNSKISVIGLRYSFLDEKVKNYVLKDEKIEPSFFEEIKNKLVGIKNNLKSFFRKEKFSC